jgi:ADP-heptose:LPS heptosyltransferase
LLIGAKTRLGPIDFAPSLLQKIAYTQTVAIQMLPISWVKRHQKMLALAWQIPQQESAQISIGSSHALIDTAKNLLQDHTIICHLGTSQPKKEWPIHLWLDFCQLARNAGYKLAFSSGTNERERGLLDELKAFAPEIFALPPLTDLALFLAVLKQARLVIVGDTAPLHFAAGLGVKIIGLFGTEDSGRYAAPIYASHELIIGSPCVCVNELAQFPTCQSKISCMGTITPESVLDLLIKQYPLHG